MRRTITGMITTIAALTMTAPAQAADVVLKVHHFLPVESTIQKDVLEPWEKAVEEQSGGRIDVEIYPSMQLGGKPPQLYDQARDGIVDVSWTLLGYTPGRFPVSEAFELPFMAGTAVQTTTALQEYSSKYMGDELRQVHPLMIHAPAAYKFHIRGNAVTSMADLDGLKIRAPSRTMTNALNALGATAVGMPVPEVPQSLTTGVIDGAVLPWEVTGSLRLSELVKNHTEIGSADGGIATSVMALVMNKAKYEGLPDELRQVIDDNSGVSLASIAAAAFDEAETAERQNAVDGGAEIAVIPAAEVGAWREATQSVVDAWVAQMDAAGMDGQAMFEDAHSMLDQARR
jgi:TRAP-type transport system periplasmic protein